jgi:imidazolonepropionase-like amidohydrolase
MTILRMSTLRWICLAAVSFLQTSNAADSVHKGSLALVGGTVYVDPSSEPIKKGLVLIQDGVITAVGRKGSIKIPKGIEVIDCTDQVITAGFWNSHTHFLERKWFDASTLAAADLTDQLQIMLTRYGFTSIYDQWSNFKNTKFIRERIESGEIPGPRIRTNGEALQPKAGVTPSFAANLVGFGPVQAAAIEDAAGARAAAIKLLDAGTDGIKIYAMTFAPRASMPEDAIAAAVEEAHRRGKLAFAHPTSDEALLAAVRSGVDVIVHTTAQPGPWNAAVLTPMKEKGVALIPTLTHWHSELKHDRYSVEKLRTATAVAQLRSWIEVGGTVLFGTDVGYIPEYDTTEEFALMGAAGMSYKQILASLTTAPAEKFGDGKRLGKVAKGMLGDIVVMRNDPSKDLKAFASVSYTIRDGSVIYKAEKL